MTVDRSQALEHYQEGSDSSEVREAHSNRHVVDMPLPENSPASTAHAIRSSPSSNPVYHTAFMQCRACCNCDSQCSYFGRGNFDLSGNYMGS